MTQSSTPTLETTARIDAAPFGELRDAALRDARLHELAVLENHDLGLCIETEYGRFRLEPDRTGVRITIRAPRRDWVQVLRDAVVGHVGAIAPQAAARLHWSDCDAAGRRPANMHVGTVLGTAPLGAAFRRVRLGLDDLGPFDDRAIHFRLLLPPPGEVAPDWPRMGPNGATVWPKGDKALHCPVYTARHVDREGGALVFDVYEHDGGRATDWARSARPGDRLAIMGPGGGGVPDALHTVLLYGDETAFPAIARSLETLPRGVRVQARLLCRTGAARSYPMPEGQGHRVTWHADLSAEGFAAQACAEKDAFGPHLLWFAADKVSADHVRSTVRAAPGLTQKKYIAGYW